MLIKVKIYIFNVYLEVTICPCHQTISSIVSDSSVSLLSLFAESAFVAVLAATAFLLTLLPLVDFGADSACFVPKMHVIKYVCRPHMNRTMKALKPLESFCVVLALYKDWLISVS